MQIAFSMALFRPGSARVPVPAPSQAAGASGEGDDRALITRLKSGDAEAFEVVFHTYYRALCNFLVPYLRSAALAEEQVQDLMFWMWDRRADLDVRTGLRAYLYVAARNRAMNWLKHQRIVDRWNRRAIPDAYEVGAANSVLGLGSGPRSAEDDLRDREINQVLAQAIAQLPERRRVAFTLAWQHGLTSAEIATVMGISLKGVEVARARAMKSLRRALADYR